MQGPRCGARHTSTLGRMAHEGLHIASLRAFVEKEIDKYVYSVPEGTVGQPMSAEWVGAQLAELRECLVEPKWQAVQLKDTPAQMNASTPVLRDCVLIADDKKGLQLYYDPDENDFFLAFAGNPPTTFMIRGDAVGCFMSR